MAEPSPKRYALVTGASQGIGFELCKQLASKGIAVILTAINDNRRIEAQERLKEFGFSENVVFHQLDVVDPASVAALVDFVETEFGRLDILINNAGISGIEVEGDVSIIQEWSNGMSRRFSRVERQNHSGLKTMESSSKHLKVARSVSESTITVPRE